MWPVSGSSLDSSGLVCSLCLQLLSDPLTVPCGHSFCRSCLESRWAEAGAQSSRCPTKAGAQSSRCPQCGAAFSPTPALGTNAVLLELLQGVKAVSLPPSAPPFHGFQHATFDLSALQPERYLDETPQTLAEQISQKESEHHRLHDAMKDFPRVVKAALKDCSRIFSELQDFVERGRVQTKQIIRSQEKAEMTRAENHLQRLEQEIRELRRRGTQDQQKSECFSSSLVVNPHISFGSVRKAVMDLKQQLESVFLQELPTLTRAVTSVSLLQMETPKRKACEGGHDVALDRESLLQYSCPLSFDPFSAHRELGLAQGNRTLSRSGQLHSYPEHEERFDCWAQALSHEPLSPRGFWEAQWDGAQAALGSSNASRLGHNSDSWCLKCSAAGALTFCHEDREQQVVIPDSARSRRVAVFADQDSGLLCFFTVTDKGLHLVHRLEKRLAQPLYAAVWLGSNSSASICGES